MIRNIFLCISILLPFFIAAESRIVFVGDSITQSIPNKDNYADLVKKKLKEDGWDVTIINYGFAGTKSDASLKELLVTLPNDLPYIVVISSGIVDAIDAIDAGQVKSNLTKMIQACLQYNAKVILGLVDISCWQFRPQAYIKQFNKVYQALAYEYPITTFPFLNDVTLGNKEYNHGDMVHPNKKGDRLIFEFLYPKVIQILQKRESDEQLNRPKS